MARSDSKSLFAALLAVVAAATLSARADDENAPTLETGFHALEVRRTFDAAFDPKSIPALFYAYREVTTHVKGAEYAIVPAATNRLGPFLRTRVESEGGRDAAPEARYRARMGCRYAKKKVGLCELALGNAGEKILRLYADRKRKDHPLAEYAIRPLGADEAAAAISLGLDPTKFAKTQYFAHRGDAHVPLLNRKGVFPGNTIEAMEHALANGYPGFEIDIQMTKDRALVVSHDEKLGVSTSCRGNVSDKLLSELAGCEVRFTGVIPDVKLFHNPAKIAARIPTLREVLDRFRDDSRVQHIVLDVKPGDIPAQAEAFDALLKTYPPEFLAKIIFLMRSTDLIQRVKDGGVDEPFFAWEGSTGWETLERAATVDDPNRIFDADGSEETGLAPSPDGLSLSLGLGLGMAGLNDHHRLGGITAVWQIMKSLPKVVKRLFEHEFGNGSVDIDAVAWSKRNKSALKRLIAESRARGEKIVGWTVNSAAKITWLRREGSEIDYVLSDLPYPRLMQIQLEELSSAL